MLDENGIKLSSVGSDIGKIKITDPFENRLKRAANCVEVSQILMEENTADLERGIKELGVQVGVLSVGC